MYVPSPLWGRRSRREGQGAKLIERPFIFDTAQAGLIDDIIGLLIQVSRQFPGATIAQFAAG